MGEVVGKGKIVTNGLVLSLDAADRNSYPGSGTTWVDLSGRGINGTLTNSPTYTLDNGGVITFDGVDDYIDLGASSLLTGDNIQTLTYCTWFLNGKENTSQRLISLKRTANATFFSVMTNIRNIDGFLLTGSLGIWARNSANTTLVGLAVSASFLNKWTHIGCVINNNTREVYINGSLSGTSTDGIASITGQSAKASLGAFFIDTNNGIEATFSGSLYGSLFYRRALSSSEILQNYNATCTRFGLLPFYNIPITQGTISGLFGRRYVGYFNDSVTWFASATLHGDTQQTTQINNFSNSADNYSWMWLGYFYSPTTGNYTFYTNSDDASYLWVGSNAISGYTTGNALVNNGGQHGAQERSGIISLTGGQYNPIRIMFGEAGGGDIMTVSFDGPSISKTTNGSGYYFDGSVSLFSTWG